MTSRCSLIDVPSADAVSPLHAFCVSVRLSVCVCVQMELLKRFDTNGHTVDEYVDRLDDLLSRKVAGINELKHKLAMFKKHLKQEEELSSSFNRKRNGAGAPWAGSAGGGGAASGYDDDGPSQQPPAGRGGGRDSSYPHLHPLPNSNYGR